MSRSSTVVFLHLLAIALVLGAEDATAQSNDSTSWKFSDSIAVSPLKRSKLFYHLESSGRKNIAASTGSVAVVWEDNRSGQAAIYFSKKSFEDKKFSPAMRLSSGSDAIEPSIAALPENQFLVAWEQDKAIWARLVTAGKPGTPKLIAGAPASQVSLGFDAEKQTYVVWSQGDRADQYIRMGIISLSADNSEIAIGATKVVDHMNKDKRAQYFPSVTMGKTGVVVAWEDRRAGHTQIFYSCAGKNGTFIRPLVMNEQNPQISSQYGSGTGAARVSLSSVSNGNVIAVWSDKRDFRSGYDVYAATIAGAICRFGENHKVQDEFGAAIAQWHPSVVGNKNGRVVATWQDDRNESADIWVSWSQDEGPWSDDLGVKPAMGSGNQDHPALTLDHRGRLHLVWLNRANPNGATELRYSEGQATP